MTPRDMGKQQFIEMVEVLMDNNVYQDYIRKDGGHPVIELVNDQMSRLPDDLQIKYLQWKLGV